MHARVQRAARRASRTIREPALDAGRVREQVDVRVPAHDQERVVGVRFGDIAGAHRVGRGGRQSAGTHPARDGRGFFFVLAEVFRTAVRCSQTPPNPRQRVEKVGGRSLFALLFKSNSAFGPRTRSLRRSASGRCAETRGVSRQRARIKDAREAPRLAAFVAPAARARRRLAVAAKTRDANRSILLKRVGCDSACAACGRTRSKCAPSRGCFLCGATRICARCASRSGTLRSRVAVVSTGARAVRPELKYRPRRRFFFPNWQKATF